MKDMDQMEQQLSLITLTDNVNRTVAEVRAAFNKNGGKIGVSVP